jgi:alkylation response protein AidB-like acyl-CoA dehydrogenase
MSEEQRMLRTVVSQIAKDHPQSYFLARTRANQFPQEFWSVLAENGFFGLEADAAYGGSGMSLADLLLLLHGLGTHGMVSYQLLGQLLAAHALSVHGTAAQQTAHLPGVIAGTRWTSAMIEDVTGGDPFACATAVKASGEGYRLAGRKLCVAAAGEAEFLLVAGRVSPTTQENPAAGLGVFVVPAGAQGVSLRSRELNMRVAEQPEPRAITGDLFADVTFDEVALPGAALLGAADGKVFLDLLSHNLLMLAATAVGWGDRVIDLAVEYAKQRVLYTEPIAAYQAIQHPMVRAKTDVEMAKLLIERAAHAFAETQDPSDRLSYASIAKQVATDGAYAAFDIAMQSNGGSSFDREVGIVTHWVLATMARMMWMSSDAILTRFGNEVVSARPSKGSSSRLAERMQ